MLFSQQGAMQMMNLALVSVRSCPAVMLKSARGPSNYSEDSHRLTPRLIRLTFPSAFGISVAHVSKQANSTKQNQRFVKRQGSANPSMLHPRIWMSKLTCGGCEQYADINLFKEENGRALEYVEEAVQLFELVVQENQIEQGHRGIQTQDEWAKLLRNFSDEAICGYSRALCRLSKSLRDDGRSAEGVRALIKAYVIMPGISHYHVYRELESELACIFFKLSHENSMASSFITSR
ncbi:hypothetical protein CPB84DRAFT_364085 [Gymnopilus junonius]|uniref:Uncharacterized protein n=1 Tax=Gymnopilus junonius TaxID=109634 RepID=A0A9P5NVI4_GYMJU|nr:hypothetical protein CPB84DRAFT_364085 [Gymnopilus junonius]